MKSITTVYLSSDIMAQAKQVSEKSGKSFSEYIENILQQHFKSYEGRTADELKATLDEMDKESTIVRHELNAKLEDAQKSEEAKLLEVKALQEAEERIARAKERFNAYLQWRGLVSEEVKKEVVDRINVAASVGQKLGESQVFKQIYTETTGLEAE